MVVAIVLGWLQVALLVLSAVAALNVAMGDPRPGLTGKLEQTMNQYAFVALLPTILVFAVCVFAMQKRQAPARVAHAVITGIITGVLLLGSLVGAFFLIIGFVPAIVASILTFVPSSQPFFAQPAPYRVVPVGPGPDLRPVPTERPEYRGP